MTISTMYTSATGEHAAVEDLLRQFPVAQPGFTFLFCSSSYDLTRIAAALRAAGCERVVGAVTGRAINGSRTLTHGITGFHLPGGRFQVADALIENVAEFGLPDARDVVRTLKGRLERNGGAQLPHLFGVLLVDAEARCEEKLIAALGTELAGIPIVGGSAGDLYFSPHSQSPDSTQILFHGRALRGAGTLCLIASASPVMAVSHNHYLPSRRRIVITDADPGLRLVREINGRNALSEYAAVCGFKRKEPRHSTDFAPYPLLVRISGQYFARGVQRCYDDGTIEFACAIEPGVVMTVAQPGDMVALAQELFKNITATIGQPELVIGFECAARTAYMERQGFAASIAELYAKYRVVGFSTLGEQFNTIHANNSFACLGIAAEKHS